MQKIYLSVTYGATFEITAINRTDAIAKTIHICPSGPTQILFVFLLFLVQ